MVPFLTFTVAGIFSGEDFRTLAVIVVITVSVLFCHEPILVTIEVLIIQIYLEFFHLWLQEVKLPSLRVRTGSTDIFYFGVLLLEYLHELLKTGGECRVVLVVPLLVTYAKIFKVERFWVSHFSAYLTPFCIGAAVCKLYKVKCVLYVRVQVVHCNVYLCLILYVILELT